jgi:two-component system phosphate regulon sensor histidine kinase PhoR
LDRAFRVQRAEAELQLRQHQQLDKQFNDRVVIALTAVAEKILSIYKDPSDLYDAVKQERPNYFAVAINDTVHPYLLEALLRKEFMRRNIGEDFEYGVYDCFTDSIVYGNYVSLMDSAVAPALITLKPQATDRFGVYPRRRSVFWEPSPHRPRSTRPRCHRVRLHSLGAILFAFVIVNEPERLRTSQASFVLRTKLHPCERVLQLATLDRENLALKQEPVDLHELIADVADAFVVQLQERNGIVRSELGAIHHVITGDSVHLSNMLFNLVDNAIKYSAENVDVLITTTDRGQRVELRVKDHGIGIAKADQHHVFERFYRVPTGNVHNVKGFGLGLHYVQQIVHAHNGTIKLESEPGQGSTFTVLFPISMT